MLMKVEVHYGQITALMSPGGEVGQAAARAAGRIRDRAKENAPVDTGLLRNSIVAELVEETGSSVTWRIGTDVFYGKYQEFGVPPIFARRAPYLVFKIGTKWISTYSTQGVPAVHFLQNALNDATIDDFN
jgi:HK97 gp10 family phage protein